MEPTEPAGDIEQRAPDPDVVVRLQRTRSLPHPRTPVGLSLAARAKALAEVLLTGQPDRLRHTAGVAQRAATLACTVAPDELEVLLAAAWLHDIGYAPAIAATGFHPFDGAEFLADDGWPPRVCALVAHHSCARLVARELGIEQQLNRYSDEQSAVSDALTCADQTVDSRGNLITIRARSRDTLRRHGPHSAQARAYVARQGELFATSARVEDRLNDSRAERPNRRA